MLRRLTEVWDIISKEDVLMFLTLILFFLFITPLLHLIFLSCGCPFTVHSYNISSSIPFLCLWN